MAHAGGVTHIHVSSDAGECPSPAYRSALPPKKLAPRLQLAPLRLMQGVDGALIQMTTEQPRPVGSELSRGAVRQCWRGRKSA